MERGTLASTDGAARVALIVLVTGSGLATAYLALGLLLLPDAENVESPNPAWIALNAAGVVAFVLGVTGMSRGWPLRSVVGLLLLPFAAVLLGAGAVPVD